MRKQTKQKSITRSKTFFFTFFFLPHIKEASVYILLLYALQLLWDHMGQVKYDADLDTFLKDDKKLIYLGHFSLHQITFTLHLHSVSSSSVAKKAKEKVQNKPHWC